jgi:hypothetical protein
MNELISNLIAPDIAAAMSPIMEGLHAVADNTGVSLAPADPLAAGVPSVPTVEARLEALRIAITDQETPIGPPMRNRPIALKVFAMEPRLDSLEKLFTQVLALSTANQDQLTVLTAQQALGQQASQQLTAAQAAYELRLTANEAKATLTASATEANRLELVKNTAADALRDARLSQDATAIAAAKATADQARAEAATAQKKADEDAAAVLVAQAQAIAADAKATAAQQSVAALAAKFRSATVTVPGMVIGGSIDVVATWPAFADTAFVAIAEPAGLALLGLDATEVITARTANSATFRIKNVLGLAIATGGTLSVFAYRP